MRIHEIVLPFLILSCLVILSREQERRAPVYVPGRQWVFTLKHSDSNHVDTLKLSVQDERWQITQTQITWYYSVSYATGRTVTTETTGVTDRSNSSFLKNEIWIHPPRSGYMRLSEMVAFPQVKFPITLNEVTHTDLTPKEGWAELEGVNVKGTVIPVGKVVYKQDMLQDSCWKLQATGVSSAGNYSAVYYYHPAKGFVYFYYDFDKYTCEIDLISTNF